MPDDNLGGCLNCPDLYDNFETGYWTCRTTGTKVCKSGLGLLTVAPVPTDCSELKENQNARRH